MPNVQVGTEYEGVPEVVPGARSIPNKAGRSRANSGTGTNSTTPPSAVLPRKCIVLTADMPVGVVTNMAGTATSTVALTTLNPAFTPTVVSFPGASTDDNDIQWVLAVPTDMANVPNISVRLHIVSS